MRTLNLKKIITVLCFVFCISLFAESTDLVHSDAQSNQKGQKDHTKTHNQNKDAFWKISTTYINNIQAPKSWFFQTNIGAGFLYFDGVRGNLEGSPQENFGAVGFGNNQQVRDKLSYNRSPLYEYMLGHRFNSWLKVAFSYQFQGQVNIQTKAFSSNPFMKKFSTNWAVNAFMGKVYLETPYPVIWFNAVWTPFIGAGVGGGWQSFTRNYFDRVIFGTTDDGRGLSFRMKNSASCVWGVDAGFRVQSAKNNDQFSLTVGCKYNQWGQASNIGKMSQQGQSKVALAEPFRIKTIYSFAPYMGVQWNFPTTLCSNKPYKVGGRNPASYKTAYFTDLSNIQTNKSFYNEFNVGLSFLYFDQVRYNLSGVPNSAFAATQLGVNQPSRDKLSYNRVPLFEWDTGYRFCDWFKAGLSYQYLNGTSVSTSFIHAPDNSGNTHQKAKFTSNLMINAVSAKIYLEVPQALIWANFATSPYLGVGVGAAWQTWNNTVVYRQFVNGANAYQCENQSLTEKVSASATALLDLGLRMQGVYPSQQFSFVTGCKFNAWGQARNIGLETQQGSGAFAIQSPFIVKQIYSFAPYIGAQWNFATTYTCNPPFKLKGKSPNVWKPYFVNAKVLGIKKGVWTQFNAGIGFLYFDKVRGNLMGRPVADFNTKWSNVPLKGHLKYNKTPLFEYQVGYRYCSWIRSSLSFQYQPSVTVTTPYLPAFGPDIPGFGRFTGTLALSSIMGKVFFELPYPMIWKNLALTPYIGAGVGPGWQSWTNIYIDRPTVTGGVFFGTFQPLEQKTSMNCVWMVDAGFKVASAYPNSKFSIVTGCKYNEWGQARNIGKITQQQNMRVGITQPFTIKTVYSFAPYFGFQWSF